MNYFEDFNEPIPVPPTLPFGWTSTSTAPANPWNRVLVSGISNYAAAATATEGIEVGTTSTLDSPNIPIGPLSGTLTFDNLYNLENIPPFVSGLVIQSDGKIVVGGLFTHVNGLPRRNLVRLNSDGTVDPTFQVDTDGSIRVIAIDSVNQMIYVGGFFFNIGGEAIRFIARITPGGVLDTTFAPQPTNAVREILITTPGPAGTLYIGGNFINVAGQERRRVAKLNYDGTLDLAFDSTANFASSTRVMALSLDPTYGLLIGGVFTLTNGRDNIGRLDPMTGALDATFMGTTDNTSDAVVNDIALDISGSGIFLTGTFSTVNTINRSMIAKLNRNDGTLNATFDPTPAFTGPPSSGGSLIYLNEAQNQLLVVGDFTAPRTGIAGLDRVTGAVTANPNITIEGPVLEIVSKGVNDFIIGGTFSNIGALSPPISLLADINVQTNVINTAFNPEFIGDEAFDGMVLEIKIGAGPFVDIITAGGSFVQGGYNAIIVPGLNPLTGRPVWSGLSAGTFENPEFITTQVNLPLSAANQLIQLRWILGCDEEAIAPGQAGTRIDNVSIIMNRPICILPGAMVVTDKGGIPIECLREGDYVFDENGNKVKVLQNFKIPMIKPMKTVCIRKGALGLSKPSGLLRLTHGHPLKVNCGDEEHNVEHFITKGGKKPKIIRSLKIQTDFVYNIVTKTRVFVNINNIFVATWDQEDLYKHMGLSK